VRLRDVELGDVDAYVAMRCDPAMMAGLGGPLPREGIEAKVATCVIPAADNTSVSHPGPIASIHDLAGARDAAIH
jgi:hypothetical protein